MKYLIFFTLLFSTVFFSFAQNTNFDFSLGKYLVDGYGEIIVHFDYDLQNYDEETFLVKPIIKNGIIEIFNSDKNSWVSSYSLMSDLPNIKKEMEIKIKGLEVEKSSVYFQIFNTSTGKIYTTPEKFVWSKKVYSKYLEKINEKVTSNLVLKEESGAPDVLSYNQAEVSASVGKTNLTKTLEKIPQKYFYIFSIFVFLISFLFGFKPDRRKVLDVEARVYGVSGKIH